MSANIGRCEEFNEVLKLRCDRSAGHRGVHIQYDGNGGVNGWGTFDEMNETVIPDHTAQRSGGMLSGLSRPSNRTSSERPAVSEEER